jgi:aspartyl-tRNA(Asn)/glutamyl-tRNA(Gln) amidotransferase subunit A
MTDPGGGTIEEVSGRIRRRQISPIELLNDCLGRIDALDSALNAFITVLPNEARAEAEAAEAQINAGHWRGPLHGIPVAIKDLFDTAGIRTTAAFAPFKERVPAKDAAAVRRLREAGAVILGKTNMHKLAMGTTSVESDFGPVRNPWNRDYIAGGSSGGSAAAVAAGMCYATLDTDAIGSCRLPAACCGVVGFKGSYGLISNQGILEGQPVEEAILWLAHAALTTRCVDDAALLWKILADPDAESMDRPASPVSFGPAATPRIGRVSNFSATPEVAGVFEAAVEVLRRFAAVSDVTAPLDSPGFDVRNIERDRLAIAGALFADVDVVVLPTTAAVTPTIARASGNAFALAADNTLFANYYGLPAISVPCGDDRNGLPLGLQIVGKPRNDTEVLRVAHQFANATSWTRPRPVASAGSDIPNRNWTF